MAKANPVQVQRFLKALDYPATKEDLVKTAEEEGADQNVLAVLNALPDDVYRTPADVSHAIGEIA